MVDHFRHSIDLSLAQARAEKIIECIKRWREQLDIRRFEYTDHLRVAPTEISHSHPVLTLNTALFNPDEILCEYLHEQMHWYLDGLGCADPSGPLIAELKQRYPETPVGYPEGAKDEYSTYLHLIVNWLEIEAASQFLARERVREIARMKHYYRWVYRSVLSDWDSLEDMFRARDIVPIRPAGDMDVRRPVANLSVHAIVRPARLIRLAHRGFPHQALRPRNARVTPARASSVASGDDPR